MKKLIPIVLFALLGACSSSPSDSDVQKITDQAMVQMGAIYAPLGIKFDDLFVMEVKIINKADQGNGRWLVQTETRMELKKSLSDLPESQRMGLAMLGVTNKGDKTQPQRSQAVLIKGDKGWIATN